MEAANDWKINKAPNTKDLIQTDKRESISPSPKIIFDIVPKLVAITLNCDASPGLPFDTSAKLIATLRSGTTATPSKRGIVRRCGFYPFK
jgi:hypothetical protein